MLTEIVNRVLAGYKERRLIIRKWLLSLRCDRITMVQPAESRQGLNLALTRREDFRRPTCWRVLRESKMSPVMPPPTFFADLMPVLRSASQVPVHRAAVRPSQDRWAISSLEMLPRSERPHCQARPRRQRVSRQQLQLSQDGRAIPDGQDICAWAARVFIKLAADTSTFVRQIEGV